MPCGDLQGVIKETPNIQGQQQTPAAFKQRAKEEGFFTVNLSGY